MRNPHPVLLLVVPLLCARSTVTEQCLALPSASRWKRPSSPFRALTLLRSAAKSAGDVMRDLDNRDLIMGDFLLVSGDVVSNVALAPALARHRARREKDKNAIMTMVLREAGVQHRTKSTGRKPVFVIDPSAERCLHYEEMGRGGDNGRYVNIEPHLLTTHGEIEVREDLIDCSIDICSLDVLGLWSDNFDYQSVRKGFLSDVLKDYELNGKTVHTFIVADQYAARVKSIRAYDAVTRDVTSRWTYPLCPDSNLVSGQNYRFGRGKVYQEDGVILARGSVVKSRSVLGRETKIGDKAVVAGSVIGRRCQIGENAVIEGAYIWDDVTIGEGAVVQHAIVASGAIIGKNCKVKPGALISFGVRIADGVTVPGKSKITRAKQNGKDIDAQTECQIVGSGGSGHLYSPSSDSDSSTTSAISSSLLHLHPPPSPSSPSSISSFSTASSEFSSLADRDSRRSSFISSSASESATKNRDFHLEATASILDGLQKADLPENIFLELNGYRMAVDADQHQVRSALVSAFMKRIAALIIITTKENDAQEATEPVVRDAAEKVFTPYKSLAERTIFDKPALQKPDQVDFLLLVQKEAAQTPPNGKKSLLCVAKVLYDLDVVEEDGVLQWWEDERSSAGEEMEEVRRAAGPFVTWLREAEEEDDDDDDDDEDEGEETD